MNKPNIGEKVYFCTNYKCNFNVYCMKIETLTFLNFRCFEEYHLNLKKGVNLLFGTNTGTTLSYRLNIYRTTR